jgi:V8-like Glu-specific endopeptidase
MEAEYMHRRNRLCAPLVGAALALTTLCGTATGQTAPIESRQVAMRLDTGALSNNGAQAQVVYVQEIRVENAPWLRLAFDQVLLSGNLQEGTGATLRITSALDGGQQILSSRSIQEWNNTSAYFNGDTVILEVIAHPGTGVNRVLMSEVTAGVGEPMTPESICGSVDDRVLSNDPLNARLMPIGCTAWPYNDPEGCGNSFGTAGHCISNGTSNAVVQFNVPLSTSGGSPVNPPPEDQYPVEPGSIQSNGGSGPGIDYAIMRTFANSNTGLNPAEAQGGVYTLRSTLPPNLAVGDDIRITGYGTVSSPVPRTWSQAQKTHVGPFVEFFQSGNTHRLRYATDTTGGNSGSPVIYEPTGEVIGVHTHAGCNSVGGNQGTSVTHPAWLGFLANPRGNCLPLGVSITLPNGAPDLIDPAGGATIRVDAAAQGTLTPQPGTGQMFADTGSGFVQMAMVEIAPNMYEGTFPAQECGEPIDYYFTVEDTSGGTTSFPIGGANDPLTTFAGNGILVNELLTAGFESGLPSGWSATGLWGVTSQCAPASPCEGSQFAYYGSTSTCSYQTGSSRNMGSLTTPSIDIPQIPAGGAATLSFCYNYEGEANPNFDKAEILVGGTVIGTVDQTNTWETAEIDLAQFAGQSIQIEFRFDTVDGLQNTSRGWQIDDVVVTSDSIDCGTGCYPDCTGEGMLDVFDFLCFQDAFTLMDPYADCDGNTTFDVFDFLCFQDAFVTGCP